MLKRFVARVKADPTVAAVLRLSWRGRGRLLCRLMKDRRVPVPARLILPLLVLYLLSPIDIVPDFIPVIGYVDDVLVVLLAAWAFKRLAPPGLVVQMAGEIAAAGGARKEDDDG